MRVASSDGVVLQVHHFGGDGPPLLVCHATGFCAKAYEPLAHALRRRFEVWAVDFRGHGDSTAPVGGDYAWTGMADDVLAVLDKLGLRNLCGVGHSMGGAALLLAELARPGLFRSTYLYEPVVVPADADGGPNPMAAAARRRRHRFRTKADAMMRYATRPPLNVLRADSLAAYVEHGLSTLAGGPAVLKCSPENEARTFEGRGKVTLQDLAGLGVPTVVAVGRRSADESVPAAMAPEVVAALARARLIEYGHLGHFGPLQDPDTVADDIIDACG